MGGGGGEGLLFSHYRKHRVQGSCSCSGSFWGLFCILYLLWLYSHGCKMEAAPPGSRSTFPGGTRAEGKRPKRANQEFVSFKEHFPKPHAATSAYTASPGPSTCKGNWEYCHCQQLWGLLGKNGRGERKEGRKREKVMKRERRRKEGERRKKACWVGNQGFLHSGE